MAHVLPLGPIAQFTFESRRALFLAAMEAAAREDSYGLAGYLAANFARSPSVAPFIDDCGVDLVGILNDLHSSPPGEEPGTGFTGVRIPDTLLAFWKQLEENFVGAPEQSVTPAQVLLLLLEYDPSVRATFEKHGFDVDRFRDTVR